MSKNLEGKVAIVTGSGQGVGKGIAVGLAREGVKVVTNNRKPSAQKEPIPASLSEETRQRLLRLKGDAESTANLIIAEGGEAVPFYGDVSDFDIAEKMVEAAIDAFGRVDIIVNNAAGLGSGSILETDESSWDYQNIAKVKGTFNLMRHATPHMVKQKYGRVINIASHAWVGLQGLAAYCSANAAVVGLTKAAAKDLHHFGITVNAICPEAESPGHVVEFNAMVAKLSKAGINVPEDKLKEVEAAHGPAENLAPFVGYLCTPEAEYINGAVFAVTGNGNINYFTNPIRRFEGLSKKDGMWTIEELSKVVPEQLLKGYVSVVAVDDHSTMMEDL